MQPQEMYKKRFPKQVTTVTSSSQLFRRKLERRLFLFLFGLQRLFLFVFQLLDLAGTSDQSLELKCWKKPASVLVFWMNSAYFSLSFWKTTVFNNKFWSPKLGKHSKNQHFVQNCPAPFSSSWRPSSPAPDFYTQSPNPSNRWRSLARRRINNSALWLAKFSSCSLRGQIKPKTRAVPKYANTFS